MIGDRFALRNKKNRVLILFLGLETPNITVVVGGRKKLNRSILLFLQILDAQFIDFLTQRHPFASAQRFAPLFSGEILIGEIGFGQLVFLKFAQNVLFCRVEGLVPSRKVLVLEVRKNRLAI